MITSASLIIASLELEKVRAPFELHENYGQCLFPLYSEDGGLCSDVAFYIKKDGKVLGTKINLVPVPSMDCERYIRAAIQQAINKFDDLAIPIQPFVLPVLRFDYKELK